MSFQEPGQWTHQTGAEVDEFVDAPVLPMEDDEDRQSEPHMPDSPLTGEERDGDSMPSGTSSRG